MYVQDENKILILGPVIICILSHLTALLDEESTYQAENI
jgi:hypothetical protein